MDTPHIVRRALALAESLSFAHSSCRETGLLLHTLAATVTNGRIGEIGTGCGVGTAWMSSALQPGVRCVTIDTNAWLVEAARELFMDIPAVQVMYGDWHQLEAHAPFQLLFADGGNAKSTDPDAVIRLLAIGGMVVLDDLTPEEYWPEEWRGKPDLLRDYWLYQPRLRAVEIRLAQRSAAIIAARVG